LPLNGLLMLSSSKCMD